MVRPAKLDFFVGVFMSSIINYAKKVPVVFFDWQKYL